MMTREEYYKEVYAFLTRRPLIGTHHVAGLIISVGSNAWAVNGPNYQASGRGKGPAQIRQAVRRAIETYANIYARGPVPWIYK